MGANLIEVVHAWAKKNGAKYILLDSRNRFKAALRAYLRFGYDINGTWVGSDGELMVRLLKRIR